MSKDDNKTKARNLAKASEVLRNRLESLAGKYLDFKFRTYGQHLYIAGSNETSSLIYASDKTECFNKINFNSPDGEEIPTRNAVARLLDYSKNFDICIGIWVPIKLLKSGETLETLCIEYDMKAGML